MHDVKGRSGKAEHRYETRDVSARSMVYSAIGLVVLTVVGLAASWLVMKYFVRVQKLGPPASPFDNTRTVPPSPRLEVSPAENWKAFEAQEKSKLATYGWIDQGAGVVRIPIERAMELSLQKGFPVRSSPPAQAATGTGIRFNSPAARNSPPAAISSQERQGK